MIIVLMRQQYCMNIPELIGQHLLPEIGSDIKGDSQITVLDKSGST